MSWLVENAVVSRIDVVFAREGRHSHEVVAGFATGLVFLPHFAGDDDTELQNGNDEADTAEHSHVPEEDGLLVRSGYVAWDEPVSILVDMLCADLGVSALVHGRNFHPDVINGVVCVAPAGITVQFAVAVNHHHPEETMSEVDEQAFEDQPDDDG